MKKNKKINEPLAMVILYPIFVVLIIITFIFNKGQTDTTHITPTFLRNSRWIFIVGFLCVYITDIVHGFKLPNKIGAILMCTGIFSFVIAYVGCIMVYIEYKNNSKLIQK